MLDIFIQNNSLGFSTVTNTVRNNVLSLSGNSVSVTVRNTNMMDVDMSTVFLGPIESSTEGQWQLKDGSPALEAGVNGVDAGMFGGSTPYVLSGIPSIPNIYELNVDEVGTSEGGLKVTIKVKANN